MTTEVGPEVIDSYVDCAGAGDDPGAQAIVDDVFSLGMPAIQVFRDLLAVAQENVGLRWQRREWTVRQEHTATGVTSRIIDRVARQAPAPAPTRGAVLVCLAEGEWHRLSADMLCYSLGLAGWEVATMAPGTRPGQLASAIHGVGPVAVAVSCALPALLPGARRMIVTAQDAGTPCLVGGRAFGSDGRRAHSIGADGWAGDIVTAAEAVAAHAGFAGPSERLDHEGAGDYAVVRGDLGRLTAEMQELLPASGDDRGNGPLELALWLVRSLLAALLCDDRSILEEEVAWVASRVGPATTATLLEGLHARLPAAAPSARAYLAGAAV